MRKMAAQLLGAGNVQNGKLFLLLVLPLACDPAGPLDDGEPLSKEAVESLGKADIRIDYCGEYGWYGDGICDSFCLDPDPDCAEPEPESEPLTCTGIHDGFRITIDGSTIELSSSDEESEEFATSGAVTDARIDLAFEGGTLAVTFDGRSYRGTLNTTEFEDAAIECWGEIDRSFRYDLTTGMCVDEDGRPGLNALTGAMVRETKDGECGDLGTISFTGMVHDGANLRGAQISELDMLFAHMPETDLRGAKIEFGSVGYWHLSGTRDAFTEIECPRGDATFIRCGDQ